jgi:hypothetical protein
MEKSIPAAICWYQEFETKDVCESLCSRLAAATIGSITLTDSYPDDLRTADSHDSTFLKPVNLESKARTQTFIFGGRNHSVMKFIQSFYNKNLAHFSQ